MIWNIQVENEVTEEIPHEVVVRSRDGGQTVINIGKGEGSKTNEIKEMDDNYKSLSHKGEVLVRSKYYNYNLPSYLSNFLNALIYVLY